MIINQNSTIFVVVIFAATLFGIVALVRNTSTEIEIKFGENKSMNIKGKSPLLLPVKTKGCLPSGESSHSLNCDNR